MRFFRDFGDSIFKAFGKHINASSSYCVTEIRTLGSDVIIWRVKVRILSVTCSKRRTWRTSTLMLE